MVSQAYHMKNFLSYDSPNHNIEDLLTQKLLKIYTEDKCWFQIRKTEQKFHSGVRSAVFEQEGLG